MNDITIEMEEKVGISKHLYRHDIALFEVYNPIEGRGYNLSFLILNTSPNKITLDEAKAYLRSHEWVNASGTIYGNGTAYVVSQISILTYGPMENTIRATVYDLNPASNHPYEHDRQQFYELSSSTYGYYDIVTKIF